MARPAVVLVWRQDKAAHDPIVPCVWHRASAGRTCMVMDETRMTNDPGQTNILECKDVPRLRQRVHERVHFL
jgi:hypothetical protein